MKMQDIFNESHSAVQLAEKLGNLSQLNLGHLINLLRQSSSAGPQGKKFDNRNIGTGSEVIDVGPIPKGLSSLRKAYKSAEDSVAKGIPAAFALYVGDTAIAFGRFEHDTLRGATREGTLAYDLTVFKDLLDQDYQAKVDAETDNWRRDRMRPPNLTSYKEMEPYYARDKGPRKYTGSTTSTRTLSNKIEEFAELANQIGQPLTVKIIMSDYAGDRKRRDRYSARDVQAGADSLKTRLAKYKLSKKPTAETIDEFIEYIRGVKQVVDTVQFAGYSYSVVPSNQSVNVRELFNGEPFRAEYQAVDPGTWDRVFIYYMFDQESMTIRPSYAVWTDKKSRERVTHILDAESYVKSNLPKIDINDKDAVLSKLLASIKSKNNYTAVQNTLTGLKKLGRDWPELDIIQRSLTAELEKSNA